MPHDVLLWIVFAVTIPTMLWIDLRVVNKKSHEVKLKEALIWSGVWIALSLLFAVLILVWDSSEKSLQFLTGYVIEKSLSVDNLFVFLLIFSYFKVPAAYQHKVLQWGIIGALIMRAVLIAFGVALVSNLHWVIFIFGAFLVFSGIKMALGKDQDVDPSKNMVVRLFKKRLKTTDEYQDDAFWVRHAGKLVFTPLILVVIAIEVSDLIFAVDSIPAILAVSQDTFIVYSSNAFAILGLRALYFALAGIMPMFRFLHYGLSLVLVFIGAKMLSSEWYHMPTAIALGVVALLLLGSIGVSLLRRPPSDEFGGRGKALGTPEAASGQPGSPH